MPVVPRWRTGIGMALILAWITAWCIAAVTLAEMIGRAPTLVMALYYCVAGLAWILPLRPLVRWMHTGRWRAG